MQIQWPADPSRYLLLVDFASRSEGEYGVAEVSADFGFHPRWTNGLNEGLGRVVHEDDTKFMRVTYPAGQWGPGKADGRFALDGGVQFAVPLARPHDELVLGYRVRFAPGFDFVRGGKLPGLVGGSAPTGCVPDASGFSARNMWREAGRIVQYVYHPQQKGRCGDDIAYESESGGERFAPGRWHELTHHVVMNTPGRADGMLRAWVDGRLAIRRDDWVWRIPEAPYEGIDTFYFSTFFGGNDASWAPQTAQTADFTDFRCFVPQRGVQSSRG